jgi:hypothetical protein
MFVAVPVSFAQPGNEVVTVSPGDNKQLQCLVSGGSYPHPSGVSWNFNGTYIATAAAIQLFNITYNQVGVYECVAFNGYGTPAKKTFTVTFYRHQENNTNLTAILFTSATLNVPQTVHVRKELFTTCASRSCTGYLRPTFVVFMTLICMASQWL